MKRAVLALVLVLAPIGVFAADNRETSGAAGAGVWGLDPSATVSPLPTVKLAPSTAVVTAPSWRKATPRSRTSRRGASAKRYSPVPERSHLPPACFSAASK